MSETLKQSALLRVGVLIGLLYCFLVGIMVLSGAVKSMGDGVISPEVMGQVSNPFMGLILGILTTTLVQSSSVTTSLVVGLVGGLGLKEAATTLQTH